MKLKASHKLGILIFLLSGPAITAVAQPFPDPCYFGGWSAGAGLGVTTFMSNTTIDTYAPNALSHTSGQTYKYGALGNLFVGYAGVWDTLYLGAELGLNFHAATDTVIHGLTQTSQGVTGTDSETAATGIAVLGTSVQTYGKATRNTVEPMLDIKPGVLLAPNSLLYARLGLSYNNINVKSASRYQTVGLLVTDVDPAPAVAALATSTPISNSKSQRVTGYRLGFGLEYMINPNLGVGSDYVYTFYDNLSSTQTVIGASTATCDVFTGCSALPGVVRNHTKAKVSDQEVLLQLIYHFNC